MATDSKPPMDRKDHQWVNRLKPWITRRIEALRDELERPGVDVENVRGRVAELRELVRLVEPDLPAEGSSGAYFPGSNDPS